MASVIPYYDPILVAIRLKLISDPILCSFSCWTVGGSPDVYPGYVNSITNPNYPSITIIKDYDQTLTNRTGYGYLMYYVHGWLKQDSGQSNDPLNDISYLFNITRNALDLQVIDDRIPVIRLVNSQCPLYDETTRTYYFMSKYKVICNNSIFEKV